ncbi:MAG: response regulator [Candidatus Gastranaerophilales bacterium]|nr:response regulator [Candidatus Gastranaerophilales bacterium]
MSYNILVVDDEENNLQLFMRTFRKKYNAFAVKTGSEALDILKNNKIDLIISDQRMPEMEGVEFLRQSMEISPNSVRILITGYADANAIINAINTVKIHRYIKKPWVPEDLINVVDASLELYQLNNDNQQLTVDLKDLFSGTITAITEALDAKDPYTSGRSKRVTYYALEIGKYLNLSDHLLSELELAGMLHDIGMIGISETILNKTEMLESEEFEIIKKHVNTGVKILEEIKQLESVVHIVRTHHERFDGKGYPFGLVGEEIPICARIIAVADAYDGIVSDRAYRKAVTHEVAKEEIKKEVGTQFDGTIVDAFLAIIDKSIQEVDKIEANDNSQD